MKSRQYPSYTEAISDLESKGELKYFGRTGNNFDSCVYTLTIGRTRYHLLVRDDGYVTLQDTTYV